MTTPPPVTPDIAPYRAFADLVAEHATARPDSLALAQDDRSVTYATLDAMMDRIASALQRDGVAQRESIVVVASTSLEYAAVFLGALRAGVAVAPLPPGSTAQTLHAMIADSGARLVFLDESSARLLDTVATEDAALLPNTAPPENAAQAPVRIALDGSRAGRPFRDWLAPEGARPARVDDDPQGPFNIIYSSGTTGTPKGIVQSNWMRWMHVCKADLFGYGPQCVTLLSTPLYSNTTLVAFLPSIAMGGATVLMAKFDVAGYLALAQRHRVTHTMLVPVQYQRVMAHPDFDRFDLSSFMVKFCTSAPFHGALKADILRRWPGGLVEFYGMTEGGGGCMLLAHEHPDKLHTVGQPMEGHDVRLIDEQGREVAVGEAGEVVGRSQAMMNGYQNQPEQTAQAEWHDESGVRFIRTGDIARFDADGFLTLFDRKKDMIISGGFNIYPSDLEQVLRSHPHVADAAVVGVVSEQWGETPVAFVVPAPDPGADATEIREWVNARVGKTQRLSDLRFTDELPRSAIGKILKRELRDLYAAGKA